MTAPALEWDLRDQHRIFLRTVYDGHNRRSGLTTMHRLAVRRGRRTWRRRLSGWMSGSD